MEKGIIERLIDAGVITEQDIDEYNTQKATGLIKQQAEKSKPTYSIIEDGVLVKFDERDLDKNGGYTIPKGVTVIGIGAFEKCKALRKVHISRDVRSIGGRAFDECRNLQTVTMTNSVGKIGYYVFRDCSALSAINLSDNLQCISDGTFQNCFSLQAVVLPKKLTKIEYLAFGHCINLTMISNLPESLSFVDSNAFYNSPIGDDFIRIFRRRKKEQNQEEQKQEKGNIK